LPGISFIYPPESKKLNPFDFSLQDLKQYIEENSLKLDSNIFSKIFTGVSSQFSKSIYVSLTNSFDVNSVSAENIYIHIINIFMKLCKGAFDFECYYDETTIKDFYCTDMHQYDGNEHKTYDSPSRLLEDFYYEKDKSDRLNIRSSDLQKIINNNIDRCTKKIDILNKTLKECEQKETLKVFGELLTSNIYSIKKGDKKAEVLNYYSEEEEYVEIPLDDNKSPSENIQHYFKKYSKLKKSAEMAEIQITSTEQELDYLQSVLTNIKNSETYDEIEEIKRELTDTGYIKFKKSDNKKVKASKPLHFISSDGIDIYVGKNNIQNDFLTLKFADKNNIWFHTKNIPGSHVIVKSTGKVPDDTLREAAILAAYYSKAKDSTKVPVDYTEVKNVKKPSGSKPGMVIYYTNKTLYVNPEKLELKKVE
jgi:predicted ribosome quality control (RQC) complex YloA/Tae2 family protein